VVGNSDYGSLGFQTKALSAQSVLGLLQGSGNGLNIVVLDACRDNPFAWSHSLSRGLSVVSNQPPGSIIAYATSAGSTAQDGTGRNGVFKGELLKNLKTPGIDIKQVFDRTGGGVVATTNSKQVPAIDSQYFGSFYLAGAPVAANASPVNAAVTDGGVPAAVKDRERSAWVWLGQVGLGERLQFLPNGGEDRGEVRTVGGRSASNGHDFRLTGSPGFSFSLASVTITRPDASLAVLDGVWYFQGTGDPQRQSPCHRRYRLDPFVLSL
jgi:hypothetical protein